jgi:transcriptional regulator with PAS, ATPase and Fis domain
MDKPGSFEMASGGTLFFDEIDSITPSLQVKLFKLLKNREVTRLGSHLSRDVDTRIISCFPQCSTLIIFEDNLI